MSVTDNGLGMTPDKLHRLFEPFNRLGAENSKVEGTGIGLVLSRRLAESMGGELHIDSSQHGTVAWLTLPRSIAAQEEPDGLAPPSQHGDLDAPMTVLYAEDNEVNVELVRHIAKLRPSIVLEIAENGATALHKARRNPPDLMLLDMSLGDMSGMQVSQALRADAHTAGIRLVALSADALARTDRRGDGRRLRGLSDQADRLPRAARCLRRQARRARGRRVATVAGAKLQHRMP